MVRSGTPEPAGGDQTLGDLVAIAAKDVSQLVRSEIDLAKSELRSELKRVSVAGALFGIAAFFAILILFSLCFAYAYLLHWAGAWGGLGGAFGFTALTLAVLGAGLGFVAVKVLKRMTGMKKTRETVTQNIGMLRRESAKDGEIAKIGEIAKDGEIAKAADDTLAVGDGQRPQIASQNPR
jgi:uncharacterized membrane protein YqjE